MNLSDILTNASDLGEVEGVLMGLKRNAYPQLRYEQIAAINDAVECMHRLVESNHKLLGELMSTASDEQSRASACSLSAVNR